MSKFSLHATSQTVEVSLHEHSEICTFITITWGFAELQKHGRKQDHDVAHDASDVSLGELTQLCTHKVC